MKSDLIPAAGVIAIILFLLKEFFENLRRRAADSRQIEAYKKLLARDCELNAWAMKSLARALRIVAEDSKDNFGIEDNFNGTFFETGDGDLWPLPVVRSETFKDAMLDMAILQADLFHRLEEAYDAAIDLDHVRSSLIAAIQNGPPGIGAINTAQYLDNLADWGGNEIQSCERAMERLYKACTNGKSLQGNHRVR